jgi:hypothetical protein
MAIFEYPQSTTTAQANCLGRRCLSTSMTFKMHRLRSARPVAQHTLRGVMQHPGSLSVAEQAQCAMLDRERRPRTAADGRAIRPCLVPVSSAALAKIVTI